MQAGRVPGEMPCVFKPALMAQTVSCDMLARRSVAEREVMMCRQVMAHMNCETLERLILERSTFPLRLKPGAPLTHAMVMRLHAGGLQGLQTVLSAPQAEVHGMVQQAQSDYGGLAALPWARIVEQVMAWQPRRRGPGKTRP